MATVPFRDFGNARGEMDRLFAEIQGLRRPWCSWWPPVGGSAASALAMTCRARRTR
jgi:hypothetical protein